MCLISAVRRNPSGEGRARLTLLGPEAITFWGAPSFGVEPKMGVSEWGGLWVEAGESEDTD